MKIILQIILSTAIISSYYSVKTKKSNEIEVINYEVLSKSYFDNGLGDFSSLKFINNETKYIIDIKEEEFFYSFKIKEIKTSNKILSITAMKNETEGFQESFKVRKTNLIERPIRKGGLSVSIDNKPFSHQILFDSESNKVFFLYDYKGDYNYVKVFSLTVDKMPVEVMSQNG